MDPLLYLGGYPAELVERVQAQLASGELAPRLAKRYPERHAVRSNKELGRYVQELKARTMKKAPPLGKVLYDDRLELTERALGLNVQTTRVQGAKLRKTREVRVASLFKDAPPEFLRMIVAHELAHLKHFEHDADFYRLCCHIESDYHQLEFDTRLYLILRARNEWPQ